MKTTITAISVKESDKKGNLYYDSFNKKNQARVAIQVSEPNLKDVWLSYFAPIGDWVTTWVAGESVDIEWSKKGDYFNFKPMKASPEMIEKLQEGAERSRTWTPPIENPKPLPPSLFFEEESTVLFDGLSKEDTLQDIDRKVDRILTLLETVIENQNPTPFD